MRAIRLALVLAAAVGATFSICNEPAFARSAGAGAAGGAAGGASGGGASGGGGGHGNAFTGLDRVPPRGPVARNVPLRAYGACFKQEQLFDAHGYAVVNVHGAECFE